MKAPKASPDATRDIPPAKLGAGTRLEAVAPEGYLTQKSKHISRALANASLFEATLVERFNSAGSSG